MLKIALYICILMMASCGGGGSSASAPSSSEGLDISPLEDKKAFTLTWARPIFWEDNTTLIIGDDLSEYRVYYGNSVDHVKQNFITINSALTSVNAEDLDADIINSLEVVYIAMSSFSKNGVESSLSEVLSFAVKTDSSKTDSSETGSSETGSSETGSSETDSSETDSSEGVETFPVEDKKVFKLKWARPIFWEDNITLIIGDDLSEYRVYYGNSVDHVKQNFITVNSALTSVNSEALDADIINSYEIIYVAMSSFSKSGVESPLSEILSFGGNTNGSEGGDVLPEENKKVLTLTWFRPIFWEDNVSLIGGADLSEYRVYYGNSPETVNQNFITLSPELTSFTTQDLDADVIDSLEAVYMAMSSLSKSGKESVLSEIVNFIP